jgi:hypothetical protein
MKQFMRTSDGDYINLLQVSNIVFEPDWTDRFGNHKPKIIYNFNYQVSLPNTDKKISDYKYSIYRSMQEYEADVEELNKLINEKKWIAPIVNNKINKIINPDKISFITHDDDNMRIIINLSTPVSFHGNYHRMTSDFVYINHTDWEEYQNNLSYVYGMLKQKEF